jgi:quercetin dioxygenase-like cupin family protein
MKIISNYLTIAGYLLFAGCSQSQPEDFNFPDGTVQHVVKANEIEWAPCPPNLPSGCEIALLDGSPQSTGLFTVRFRATKDFMMPPHTHPKDERVTVLEGRMLVSFGIDGTRENAKQFGPGDYYINARNEIHKVWADTLSIIQISGIGPWESHFVENSTE